MKLYGICPKKREAREVTIIEAWRNFTGLRSIPKGRQLWSLCGPMYDESTDGLLPSCELRHLVDAGLLNSTQYHGVEIEKDIHVRNKAAVKTSKYQPHLYNGEMYEVMSRALREGWLLPSLVVLDSIFEPTRAACFLGQVLHLLNRVGGVKMVVLNAIIDAPVRGRRYNLDCLVDAVCDNVFTKHQLDFGWQQSSSGWVYNGTGVSSTKMGTLLFAQPYKEAACSA